MSKLPTNQYPLRKKQTNSRPTLPNESARFRTYIESHLEELFYKLTGPQDDVGELFTLTEDNMRLFFKNKTQFEEFLKKCTLESKSLDDLFTLSKSGVHTFDNIDVENTAKSFRVNDY